MSATNQPRQPKGVPAGGQFASTRREEASVPIEGPDDRRASLLTWAEALEEAFASEPEIAEALCEAQKCIRRGLLKQARYWLRTANDRARELEEERREAALSPAPTDRDLRLAQALTRGDLVFEGELLSNAYQLDRHEPELGHSRVFHWTERVQVGDEEVAWDSLSAAQQFSYIAGYARAVAGGEADPMASTAYLSGYRRGVLAAAEARMIGEGQALPEQRFHIADSQAVGRRVRVRNARLSARGEWGGQPLYEAEVDSGQFFWHHDDTGSRVVPWHEGAWIVFTADALGLDPPKDQPR